MTTAQTPQIQYEVYAVQEAYLGSKETRQFLERFNELPDAVEFAKEPNWVADRFEIVVVGWD